MFTMAYRGYFIHGYCDRAECSVSPPEGGSLGRFHSLAAAKRFVRSLI